MPPPARTLPAEANETTVAPTLLTPDGQLDSPTRTPCREWAKGTGSRALRVLFTPCRSAVALVTLGMVYDRERQRSPDLRQLAAETFFQTRELMPDLSRVRRSGTSSNTLARSSYRLTKLAVSYDRYLDLIFTYSRKHSPIARSCPCTPPGDLNWTSPRGSMRLPGSSWTSGEPIRHRCESRLSCPRSQPIRSWRTRPSMRVGFRGSWP